jgi:hypothetical protein
MNNIKTPRRGDTNGQAMQIPLAAHVRRLSPGVLHKDAADGGRGT